MLDFDLSSALPKRSYQLPSALSIGLLLILVVIAGCSTNGRSEQDNSVEPISEETTENHQHPESPSSDKATTDTQVPPLTPVTLGAGETLQVVATTNLVADVVAQIGGDHIALYSLMDPGVDPHSYTTTPQDLRTLAGAHVVFINGLGLEAALADLFDTLAAPVVAVNTTVVPHALAEADDHEEAEAHEEHEEHEEHQHEGIDPHTWQAVANVKAWVATIRATLSQLDPANAAAYTTAAEAYLAQLDELEAEIQAKVATVPPANRKLVTDHETFGYFADAYGFTVIGALIPSLSTTAEPSAQALAALQDQITHEEAKAIFVGTTVSPRLAEQLAQDLGIPVVRLYSDSLSAPDGPAATYLDFMRYNVDAIVSALQ
ncbi:MAG: metal ABC transporter substrate-binding protein [Caldilineaceae bacterium]